MLRSECTIWYVKEYNQPTPSKGEGEDGQRLGVLAPQKGVLRDPRATLYHHPLRHFRHLLHRQNPFHCFRVSLSLLLASLTWLEHKTVDY